MNSRRFLAVVSLVVAPGALGWVACGGSGSSATSADAGNSAAPDGGSGSGSSGGGVSGTPACPALGNVSGPGLSGDICAEVVLERGLTIPSQLLLITTSSLDNNRPPIHVTTPANATAGALKIVTGVSMATSGVYPSRDPSRGTCGGVWFCVTLPVPTSVDCDAAAGSPSPCPIPENCYAAQAPADCVGNLQTPEGSWTLTLTSLAPNGDGGAGTQYLVHGTFTATMIGEDAGLGTAELSMTF